MKPNKVHPCGHTSQEIRHCLWPRPAIFRTAILCRTGDPFLWHVGAYKDMAPRSHFSVEDTEQYQYVLTNFVSQSIRSNERNPYTFKFHMCSV